jgi:hypothetical protein
LRLTHADQRYGTLAKLDRQAGIGMFSREPGLVRERRGLNVIATKWRA